MDLQNDGTAPGVTDRLKPKEHFNPIEAVYEESGLFLYKELTGDKKGVPDGKPEPDEPRYLREFDPKILKADRDANKQITRVRYFQDPWGYPYGYSTAAAREEMLYQLDLKENGKSATPRRANLNAGFNSVSFDMWSTAGSRPASKPAGQEKMELEWAKWIKNW